MEAASAETTRFCPMCAAPIRPRATFCHQCGTPYPEESAVVYDQKKFSGNVPNTEEFESEWDTLTNNNGNAPSVETEKLQPISPELKTDAEENKKETEENSVEHSENKAEENKTEEKTERKKRVRHRVVQTTEYVWEEPRTDPTWRFALATVVILIFAFFVLWFGRFISF